MKNIIDIIILSLAIDENTFLKTKKCVDSYIKNENFVLTKKNFGFEFITKKL